MKSLNSESTFELSKVSVTLLILLLDCFNE